ncbi:GCN5-related N-acetyltransferase [Haloterrigena turkmenica DSM 5511]|uniref:GCN5-related N-acetyltransferase n=1 Tax=Haloterrigena turkmenica (strain ATCC 51198 / DSM 5511 / JCM 9101 / NCIMB 13204 / VKM B-1734 / 4k) TaxID=543526 RepID=D2RW91_HALTV|nr:GNAT family N-acetyltransferase [Haloterrigena turkmenica]ADB59480.1 GCN5-related N-acetyltransferase [Haloterrigena turkmenica DSM 5511]
MVLDSVSDFGLEIRRATHDDYAAVADFTGDIWPDRGGDYIPRVYHEWLEDEPGQGKKTFLAEVDGEPAGIVQGVMLTDDEAWFQSLRVAADYRRRGVSRRLNEATFEWAREQGATVGRVMIFSWNAPSLGAARANGFEPITEFRFAHPDPDPDAVANLEADGDDSYRVSSDPTAAWRYWTHSDAREHLDGLAMAPEESWAVRELTRTDLERLADETAVFAVTGPDGLAGMAYRSRTYEREVDGDSSEDENETESETERETWAEYGVGAWDDVDAARALFAAIARDAADRGADETRVLIPETPRHVTDAPYAGAGISEEPDFVLGIDLRGE